MSTSTIDLPVDILVALEAYKLKGVELGHFMMATLEGDLFKAVMRADLRNRALIPAIALYIRENFPRESYGTVAKVASWQQRFATKEAA